MTTTSLDARADALFETAFFEGAKRVDRIFAGLITSEYFAGILIALFISPYSWAGRTRTTNIHVYAAIFLGAAICSLPVYFALKHPGERATRHVIAVGQVLWSALLIHLTGGRIETHFHIFGSLAFIAFYRDWQVLVPATLVVAADHLVRQLFFPESVYGTSSPEWWRFLEHAGWVVFEDIFLVLWCVASSRELCLVTRRQAEIEALSESERTKSVALDQALGELRGKQDQLVRAEKLAAVGQLAASVGHELRNPLAAVRNASAFVQKKIGAQPDAGDAKVKQMLVVMNKEIDACSRIISDLLDFARERPPTRHLCPLRSLVDDAMSVVIAGEVMLVNEVPDDLPVPALDKDQFRQVLVNLLQNAVEASAPGAAVTARAEGGGACPFVLRVVDRGAGISQEALDKVFEPLFTTKSKGTGLGLAVVANLVRSHGGTIAVESTGAGGTTFRIDLPAAPVVEAA